MQAMPSIDMPVHQLCQKMVMRGLITKDQLAVAEVTRNNLGGDLTHILLQKGFVREPEMLNFFSAEMQIPVVDLSKFSIDKHLLRHIPFHLAKKFCILPYSLKDKTLTLALADPSHCNQIKEALNHNRYELGFVIATRRQIEKAISEQYQILKTALAGAAQVEIINEEKKHIVDQSKKAEELAASVGAVEAVGAILEMAHSEQASDIHIEPQENYIRVRLRIDGILEEKMVLSHKMLLPIVSRIKIISAMNIAEKRAPQDGRLTVKIKEEVIDCRTSTYPTVHGEKVVIRLLRKGSLKKLDQLGMYPHDAETFHSWVKRPHGLIFVTGPTGSGKSTTLYAALQILNSIERNITSIEDPVENEIAGINQAQLNNKANMTFASAMRSMLRQDPDVIMVGEVRDAETAEMALRAALTGHLVLSTLHTNTAVGAVSRLVNLGIPPFLLSAALVGVLGQRLVRKICPQCRVEYQDTEKQAHLLNLPEDIVTYKGQGCDACRQTGYVTRIGIFELFTVNENVRTLIEGGATDEAILSDIKKKGYVPMIEDGRKKITDGLTTMGEVLRVTETF